VGDPPDEETTMSKRTKALTRELHEKGLRTRLARRAAEAIEASDGDGAPTGELREIAETLRGLASELDGHAAPAEAPAPAASKPAAAQKRAPTRKAAPRKPPSAQRAKPRARRN
jgi:hypothetical protein